MNDLLDLVDGVIDSARPGEQIEAVAVDRKSASVRVYGGEVEQLSTAGTQGVGIRVIRDGRQGFAWAGSLDRDVVDSTLADARDNAEFAEPDEWVGLAAPDGVSPPDLDIFRAEMANVPTEAKIDLALETERRILAADDRVSLEDTTYRDSVGRSAIASTAGVRASEDSTGCSLTAYSMATDKGETQTGFGFTVGRQLDDLVTDDVVRDSVDRAVRALGATKPETGRATVVFDPWVTAQFLSIIASTLSGEAVLKGRSLFAHRLGEPVAATHVGLVDGPDDPEAWGATAIDGEGLATRRNTLIDGGVLRMFCHNAYTGRRSDAASTGSAVRGGFKSTPGVGCHAIALLPGETSRADLIAGIDDGILITDVSGLHSGVNPVSGDFSTGAEGIRIRGGQLAEPLREFTVASTIQRMLQDLGPIGSDVTQLPMSATGVSVVVYDVTISGE